MHLEGHKQRQRDTLAATLRLDRERFRYRSGLKKKQIADSMERFQRTGKLDPVLTKTLMSNSNLDAQMRLSVLGAETLKAFERLLLGLLASLRPFFLGWGGWQTRGIAKIHARAQRAGARDPVLMRPV